MLKLEKMDYTRNPMAKLIRKTSVFDYCPKALPETGTPEIGKQETSEKSVIQEKPLEPAPVKKLYGSAKPPGDF